jgi:hypothetical protein
MVAQLNRRDDESYCGAAVEVCCAWASRCRRVSSFTSDAQSLRPHLSAWQHRRSSKVDLLVVVLGTSELSRLELGTSELSRLELGTSELSRLELEPRQGRYLRR